MAEKANAKKINRQFSAGGVVFRKSIIHDSKPQIKWLVAKSNPSKEFPFEIIRLPKGWLDDEKDGKPGPLTRGVKKANEDQLREAAIREVKEEGGVDSVIIAKIGSERWFFTIDKDRIFKFVTYYLMEWKKDLPEGFGKETAQVYWLLFNDAYKKLSYTSEKKILKKANELLQFGKQESLI